MLAALDAPAQLDAWRRRAIIGALVALLAVAALLAIRRFAGAFTAPLPAPQLVALAAVAGMVSLGVRAAWRRTIAPAGAPDSRRLDALVGTGGSVTIVLLALGCSYPPDRAAPWLLWLSLLVADYASARTFFHRQRAPRRRLPTADMDSPADEPCVLQQLVRTRDANGEETIHGSLRADFVPGQRHATVHVGFCPPLASLPEVAAELADGPDATVKIVQAFAHGARLEIRLATAATTPCHVLIDLSAAPSPDPAPSSKC